MEMNDHNITEKTLDTVTGGAGSVYDCPEPDGLMLPCEKYICKKCGNKHAAHRVSCPVGKTDRELCDNCRFLLYNGTVCSRNVVRQHNGG